MARGPRAQLSRRERQILDALFRLKEGGVTEVRGEIPDPPGYDAVRTTLRVLEEKGVVAHRREGKRYVYRPAVSRTRARRAALEHLVRTFFDGSAEAAAVALLRLSREEPDDERLAELLERIAEAEEEGAP